MAPPLHSWISMTRLIIFTDLDGTLLDHDSYSWRPAEQALRRLEASNIPLIFNSSKTLAEISQLHRVLDNRHPFIIENGGGAWIPPGYFDQVDEPANPRIFGKPYTDIIETLALIRTEQQFNFRGFNDMRAGEVAAATGLSEAEANRAKQRCCSEPLIWMDSEQQFDLFCFLLQDHELQVVGGGRFFHVMGETDKGRAMHWLLERFRQSGIDDLTSIALGDSPNDRPMLEQADYAVVVKNRGGHMMLERTANIIYTHEPGPAGWQTAIDTLLDQLGG